MRALSLVLLVACGPGSDTAAPITGPTSGGTGTSTTLPTTTDTGTPPVAGVPVVVAEGTPVTCADPALRESLGPYERVISVAEPPKQVFFWGAGVVSGDFNGDGIVDMMLPGYAEHFFYLGKQDGTLDARHEALEGIDLSEATGGSAADYDGDGDLDIYVTRLLQRDVLLRNDGQTWTDVTDTAGISSAAWHSMSSAWADYDGDGDLDLVVGSYGWIDTSGIDHADFEPGDPSVLYRNNGDGTFTDVSGELPAEAHEGYTFVASWLDMNWDAKPDLYFVNDFGEQQPNRLLWNRGGSFELDDNGLALDITMTGMGLGVGDLNDDTQLDLVMPEWNGVHLRESNELGVYVETAYARGVYNDNERDQKVGWGAEMFDADNDGDLDIHVAYGNLDVPTYDAPDAQPDGLYIQGPGSPGDFVDEGAAWGTDDVGQGRGFALVDINQDGWLDLVKRDLAGPTVLYRSRCGAAHWVVVRLTQEGMNGRAIGARVRVWTSSGRQMRVLRAGGTSHASNNPPEMHFGLGADEAIDRIEILWPDGQLSNVWELPADRVLTITRDG